MLFWVGFPNDFFDLICEYLPTDGPSSNNNHDCLCITLWLILGMVLLISNTKVVTFFPHDMIEFWDNRQFRRNRRENDVKEWKMILVYFDLTPSFVLSWYEFLRARSFCANTTNEFSSMSLKIINVVLNTVQHCPIKFRRKRNLILFDLFPFPA